MHPKRQSHLFSLGLCLCLMLGFTGCKTTPKPTEAIFYPPAPDEPRIQFLTSFSSESQLGGSSKFSKFILGQQAIHRPIWKPYGVTTTPGKIYVCDTQPKNVSTVDLEKLSIRYLRPQGQGAMKLPINVAADPDGTRYVTDTGRGQVLIYDPEGNLKSVIGGKGEAKPCGIAVSRDRLYVSDLTNHCVNIYQKASRKLLLTLPLDPKDEKSRLGSPTNLAVDKDGNIYVSDTGYFCIQVYSPEGQHLRTIGEMGIEPGRFALPKGVGVDREGIVYAVDAAAGVVQMFDSQGRILMYFGEPNSGAPLYLPAGLCVDYDNVKYFQQFAAPGVKLDHLILVANQAGDRKISVYGFIKKK